MNTKANPNITGVEKAPSRWVMRARGVKRILMWNGFSKSLPLYLVTEFPKSGGTWYSQMLAECLELPFARNYNPPKFESCIMHGVFLYSKRFHNVSVVMRDGRDIMVSSYYHFLFNNNANLPYAVEKKRKFLQFKDYDDIETNLPRFIEYMFTDFSKAWSYRCTWASYVDSWKDQGTLIVKYEELLDDAIATMNRAVTHLTGSEMDQEKLAGIVSAYSFEKLTGRKRGQTQKGNFIRKGIAGDWKNHFNQAAREAFNEYGGQQLIDLGYESSSDWVNNAVQPAKQDKETETKGA